MAVNHQSHLQWLTLWSEFSYVKQVFFSKNTFWCFFFWIFSYSGYDFVFSLLQQSIVWAHTVQSVKPANRAVLCSVPLSVRLLQALSSQNRETWTHLWIEVFWERNLTCRYPSTTLLLIAIGWVVWVSSLPRPRVQLLRLMQPGPNPVPTEAHSRLTPLSFGSGFSCRAEQQ